MALKNKGTALASVFNLGKVSISLPIAASAFTGYILFSQHLTLALLLPVTGVFLMASGASALNQVQERMADGLMERTRFRPLPAGILTKMQGLLISIAFILAGSLLLYLGSRLVSLLLGLFTLAWYNGLYTPLKKKTAFAIFPGALVGAIPPMIGWTAAGGYLFDRSLLTLSFFFFLAQVPHFWIILLRSGSDYEKAGFPVLSKVLSQRQIERLTFTWVLITAIGSLLLLLSVAITGFIWISLVVINSAAFVILFGRLLFSGGPGSKLDHAFNLLNVYVLMIMMVVMLSNLFHHY